MVPKAVLMRSGLVSLTTDRPVNTAQPRSTVNSARPMTNVFNKAHSTIRRPINNKTASKNNNFNQRVNTVSGKNVNAARPKAVVNTAKPKAVLNAFKGNQGNPQIDFQDQGVIYSGCSRHMTGNMSYLIDFKEINGGYVAFGGNPKGRKITSREFYKELETEILGEGAQLMGLHFIQRELRLRKNPSMSFRPVKSAEILLQFWALSSFGVSLAHDGSWSKWEPSLWLCG
ncbi:hypothetical protein Tco_0847441 [Tanacetum coccineum]